MIGDADFSDVVDERRHLQQFTLSRFPAKIFGRAGCQHGYAASMRDKIGLAIAQRSQQHAEDWPRDDTFQRVGRRTILALQFGQARKRRQPQQ